jgi:hypothetical protein
MIQTIKKHTLWLVCITAFILTSCDKTLHEIPEEMPEKGSSITIGINTDEIKGTSLKDVHLYFFDASEMLAKHSYYATMQSLALDRMLMESGYYTIFAVLNTEESLLPVTNRAQALPEISFSDFCQWVKSLDDGTYPDLATGMVRYEVKEGVAQVVIDVKKGSEAVEMSTVTLNLTFPSPRLPDFVTTKSRATGDAVRLRAIIEVYKKDKKELVLRKQEFLTPTATEGVYATELQLSPAKYDLRIWGDYTTDAMTDNHYITADADIIRIRAKADYTANSDTRDAFCKAMTFDVGNKNSTEAIEMHRPVAKYRLVATDVKKYEQIRKQKGYPALEDLQIFIGYEGFLPNAYSISLNKPADADTGYSYDSALSEQEESKATIAKDYILVNGTQSFVTVTILFKDAATGKTVSGVKGVKIEYRAGQLTTVSGDFLTAGLGSGITINTDWSGDYDVEF